MLSFVGAAMSGMETALVDLPLGTSPRASVLVTAPTVILAATANGGPGLSRCSRARWRSGWFAAGLGNSGVGSRLWMTICAAALAGQSQQSKAASAYKMASELLRRFGEGTRRED